MVAEIRASNPKPADSFSTTPMVAVVPDILMRRASDGGWLIEFNPDALPRVLLNERLCREDPALSHRQGFPRIHQ